MKQLLLALLIFIGSIDLFVGPKAPNGKGSNWVETNDNHNSMFLFRFYGPKAEAKDGSWVMDGFRKVDLN